MTTPPEPYGWQKNTWLQGADSMARVKRQILDMNAFDAASGRASPGSLLKRRVDNVGAASVLFYDEPLELVSAKGCWVTDRSGVSYLDCYNNVPSVGHSHPLVARAVSEQMSVLNINSRYLCEVTEQYLERLKARLPAQLENLVLTCSGSEANDLALRIARKNTAATGMIVTTAAYHGNTASVTEISPSSNRSGQCPGHVAVIDEPGSAAYGKDIERGFASAVSEAIVSLQEKGVGVAALICDSIFSSDGVFPDPAGFLRSAVDRVHDCGGLFIADEVQPGFARTGEAFWGFERHQVSPDIISMGKPMGNGYPLAGIAVRPELLAAFCEDVGYFNTFGCTPAAAAAGMAVLEVIDNEGLQENALTIGQYLRQELLTLARSSDLLAEVRGAGLYIGVDICDPDSGVAAPEKVSQLINALRQERVLIGAAGAAGQALKIRPPLCLDRDEVDFFLQAMANALARTG